MNRRADWEGIRRGAEAALLGVAVLALTTLAFLTASPRIAEDRPFRVAAGLIPPYFDEAGAGDEAERIRRVLYASGAVRPDRPIVFHVTPFSRHWGAYLDDARYDAVATVPIGLDLTGARSAPYAVYQNGLGYACDLFPDDDLRDARFETVEDFAALAGLRVVAFGGAAAILPALSASAPSFAVYIEINNQKTHSELLLSGRVDVVVADIRILDHYNRAVDAERGAAPGWRRPEEICFAPVFDPTPYGMVFRSDRRRTLFNAGLTAE